MTVNDFCESIFVKHMKMVDFKVRMREGKNNF